MSTFSSQTFCGDGELPREEPVEGDVMQLQHSLLTGPRTVVLHKSDRGYGFTLRHFIVYPPDGDRNVNDGCVTYIPDEESGSNHGGPLEPMDTIFVKYVKESGPAEKAGLHTGDRIVSVNGITVSGKSYSQVVQLIQQSSCVLQLLVVPKEDDILQLYFPGTAYRSSPECQEPSTDDVEKSVSSSGNGFDRMPAFHSLPSIDNDVRDDASAAVGCFDSVLPSDTDLGSIHFFDFQSCRAEVAPVSFLNGASQRGCLWSVEHPDTVKVGTNLSSVSTGLLSSVTTSCSVPAVATDASALPHLGGCNTSSVGQDGSLCHSALPSFRTLQTLSLLPLPANAGSARVGASGSQLQDSAGFPQNPFGFVPAVTLMSSPRHELPTDQPVLPESIISRMRATFEKKEEFLLRPMPAAALNDDECRAPFLPRYPASTFGASPVLPQPDRSCSREALPPSCVKVNRGFTVPAMTSSYVCPSNVGDRSRLQTHLPIASSSASLPLQTLTRSGETDDLVAAGRPAKSFISSLSRIQENIAAPQLMNETGAKQRPQIHPFVGSGFLNSFEMPSVMSSEFERQLSRNVLLKKACPLDSDQLPVSSATECSSGTVNLDDASASATSLDAMPLIAPRGGSSSASHIVSQRARQFEFGAIEREANLRMNLYKNELARMTTRGETPRVSDRAAHFESLSTSQETLGSESDVCPSPRQRSASKKDGSEQLCDAAVFSSVNYEPARQLASHPVSSNEVEGLWAPLMSYRQMDDADSNRHKAVRQNSYLTAVKSSHKADATGNHGSEAAHSNSSDAHRSGAAVETGVVLRRRAIYETEEDENYDGRGMRKVTFVHVTSGGNHDKEADNVGFATQHHSLEQIKDASVGSRSQSIQKLKAFFGEKTPRIVEASERKPLREFIDNSQISAEPFKEGWLHSKVISVHGKRATDRSWKQMWVVLKASSLYMLKDKKDITSQMLASVEHPIDVGNSRIDIATDYTKKKHVFRLSTPLLGSEYLFQADSNGEMLHWIKRLRESESGIVLKKSTLFESHLSLQNGSRRTVRKLGILHNRSPTGHSPTSKSRKSSQGDEALLPKSKTWRGKMVNTIRRIHGTSPNSSSHLEGVTIGVVLEDCPPSSVSEFVPLLVELCTSIVEAKGLDVIGIYRVPGNTAAVSYLLDAVNRGFDCLNLQDPKWNDVNVISSLLKAFFRKLPEPLVTCELYPLLIEASKIEDPARRMHVLRKTLRELPEHNYETLKFLIGHLRNVVAHSGINKMEARNLAIVFGPTLLRTVDDNMVTMVTDMSYQCRIVEHFITHGDWFFNEDENRGVSYCDILVSDRESNPSQRSISNENVLLNNAQKIELNHGSVCKTWDIGARDIMSSIIGAANRKVRQKMKKSAHAVSEAESRTEEGCVNEEMELQTWMPRIFRMESGCGDRQSVVVGTGGERRYSEDSSSASSQPVSLDFTVSRKMSVDSLDASPFRGGAVRNLSKDDMERMFCIVRHRDSSSSLWNCEPVGVAKDFAKDSIPVSCDDGVSEQEKLCDEIVLRTHGGISNSVQERIRRFELETKALLQRDLRRQKKDVEQREVEKQRIEMAWQRAKKELEHEDFLDQLADNPLVAKKISDITRKIQELNPQWTTDLSGPAVEYSGKRIAQPITAGTISSYHRDLHVAKLVGERTVDYACMPNLQGGSHNQVTNRGLLLSQSTSNLSPRSMKRVSSSIDIDDDKQCVISGFGLESLCCSQNRITRGEHSARRIGCKNGELLFIRESRLQPSSKIYGSLDSLRDVYETTKVKDGEPCLGFSNTSGRRPVCDCARFHASAGGQCRSAGGINDSVVKGLQSVMDNLKGVDGGAEVQFHRNENTLITATLSTTMNTITTTSSTAVINATIVSRSSVPTTVCTPAAIRRGNTVEGSETTSDVVAEKRSESQKRLSESANVNSNFKKGRASPPPHLRRSSHIRNLKRRHTVGGTKDFEKLHLFLDTNVDDKAIDSSTEENATAIGPPGERILAEVSTVQDSKMKAWLQRKWLRTSSPELHWQHGLAAARGRGHVMQSASSSSSSMEVDSSASKVDSGVHSSTCLGQLNKSALESQV